MSPWQDKRPIAVVSACMSRDGTPGFVWNEVELTHEEYEEGLHYQLAMDRLLDSGYEEPFVHFDQFEAPAFLHPAVQQQQVDQVVIVIKETADATRH